MRTSLKATFTHYYDLATHPTLRKRSAFVAFITNKSSESNSFKWMYASVASVHGLSPDESSAQADSTSELLRFL